MSDEAKTAFEKWWMGEPVLDHITASNVENAWEAGYQAGRESEREKFVLCDNLKEQSEKLQEENKELLTGFKGACPTCELVGELNKKLKRQNELCLKSEIKTHGVNKKLQQQLADAEKVFAENKELNKVLKELEIMEHYYSEAKQQRNDAQEKNKNLQELVKGYRRAFEESDSENVKLKAKIDSATILIKNLRVFNPELVNAWFEAIDKENK